jgi:hypothetical protein
MIVFIYIVLVIILIVLIALVAALNSFDMNVKNLFQQSEKRNIPVFHSSQLSGLPMPVQLYFRHVLKNGQPYINYVRLKHHGRFKTSVNAKWKPIEGEEYFTVGKPGFIWKGKMGSFTAIDSFIDGEGSLKVYLFSVLRIANGYGSKFSQGELLRWLGESVWFPTALLPNDFLHWEPISDHQAKLVFNYKKLVVFYIVTFNDAHEIVELETTRYMGGNKLETWVGKMSNYKSANNVMIPTTIQATWKLEGQDFTYAVFYLNQIEYNIAEKFK